MDFPKFSQVFPMVCHGLSADFEKPSEAQSTSPGPHPGRVPLPDIAHFGESI